MDQFELHLLQSEQYRLMKEQNPLQDAKTMLAKGFEPMLLASLQLVWGNLKDGVMTPYMVTSKNAQGVDVSSPVPLELIFVGQTSNPQLTSMGNIRHEKSMPMIPAHMHFTEGAHNYIECNFDQWSTDPMTDLETNEVACNFNKSKAKQGITLVASPNGDEFGARTTLDTILGKRGLVNKALAYFVSQPENRSLLVERFSDIARSYTADHKASIYRAVFDDLTGKANGYHFGYEAKGGSVTLPVYNNLLFESNKKDKDGKRIKPDNSVHLRPDCDNTTGLMQIFKKMLPRSTYRPLKKTDIRGVEIGHGPNDQMRLQSLHNPLVSAVIKARVFFNSYNSFTLDCEPDHSGIKILYDGEPFTQSEIATFDEWKRTGSAPPRHQINLAMASDLSNIANLAKSDAMKARRDEFYRMQAGNVSNQLVITLPSVIEDDARDLFADIDAEESDAKRVRLE